MAADNRLDSDPKKGQKEDSDLQQVISWLLNNNIPPALPTSSSYWLQTLRSQKNYLLLKDGILYRQWLDVYGGGSNRHLQLVVPKYWIRSVLKQYHDACSGSHFGTRRTLEKIRFRFYWPGQRHDVENWCKAVKSVPLESHHLKPGGLLFKPT